MAYKIRVSLQAQLEIENAIEYYARQSTNAPVWFIESLQNSYKILSTHPFFEIRHKNVRAYTIKRFPFSLYFTLDEKKCIIRILSCFHNARKPRKR